MFTVSDIHLWPEHIPMSHLIELLSLNLSEVPDQLPEFLIVTRGEVVHVLVGLQIQTKALLGKPHESLDGMSIDLRLSR